MGRKSKAVYSVKNDLKSKKLSSGKNSFFKGCNRRSENEAVKRHINKVTVIAK